MEQGYFELIKFLVGVGTGSVAGSLITWLLTRRRQRIETSFKIVDYYLSIYDQFGEARYLLKDNMQLVESEDRNTVLKIGNWFDFVAALWMRKLADRNILREVGLDKTLKRFYEDAKRKSGGPDNLNDALNSWSNLKEFVIHQGGRQWKNG